MNNYHKHIQLRCFNIRRCYLTVIAMVGFLVAGNKAIAQCTIEKGAGPRSSQFKTGGDGPGSSDRVWMIAEDSINAPYRPATVMDSLPSIYYSSSEWISLANPGEHSGDRLFYFKTTVDLPCKNLCDVPYSEPNTFCLAFDIYVDNSILEIYVNGVPQSDHLDKIPMDNPFRPHNHSPNTPIPVQLCQNWQPGSNTLIIVVASSATILGLMVMESKNPPFPPGTDTLQAEICQGDTYFFNDEPLTTSGLYWHSYTNASGCDSLKVLQLTVHPVPSTTITTTICEGQSFEGYSEPGTYTDAFATQRGCDSIRLLHLTVNKTPQPTLGNITSICQGDSIVLSPGNFINYLWQDGSSGKQYVVKNPGVYSVAVSNGCFTAQEQIEIRDGLCEIRFPNAFSPNGDGKNERFLMVSDLAFSNFQLSIFNRWGQKIFESEDPSRAWDGTYGGVPQPAGTYVWRCRLTKSGELHQKNGTVVLFR